MAHGVVLAPHRQITIQIIGLYKTEKPCGKHHNRVIARLVRFNRRKIASANVRRIHPRAFSGLFPEPLPEQSKTRRHRIDKPPRLRPIGLIYNHEYDETDYQSKYKNTVSSMKRELCSLYRHSRG